jgi:hypothetical protein
MMVLFNKFKSKIKVVRVSTFGVYVSQFNFDVPHLNLGPKNERQFS